MEELGLKEGAEEVVESIESALDGEDWLLESNVEIQIGEDITAQDQHEVSPEELLNDMPTLRVGTGFQSLGDADDEGEFEEDFRGRSTRRSAIDITREHLGMANSWSNWDLKPRTISKSCGGRLTARSLVRKMKDSEVKTFAEKARRGLRLTIDRAKSVASKTRSDTSRSPTKTEWDSGSSTMNTPTVVTRVSNNFESKGLRTVDHTAKEEETIVSRRIRRASQGGLTALPACGRFDNDGKSIVGAVSASPYAQESIDTTPTSISSSITYDLAQTSGDKWEDHLRQDLGGRTLKHSKSISSIPTGNKSDIHFDASDEGRRLLSTDTSQSDPTTCDTSSGNWAACQRLDEELAGRYLDESDDHKRLLSTPTMQSSAATASEASSIAEMGFAREVSTADMDRSISDVARSFRHAHNPSVSSVGTMLSPSPQTSPPRLSPSLRMRGGLSFHPLETVLGVGTGGRDGWEVRVVGIESSPLRSGNGIGLEGSPMREGEKEGAVCVHEWESCGICGGGIGELRVVSCVCGAKEGCEAESRVVRMLEGMEVCDRCAGMR